MEVNVLEKANQLIDDIKTAKSYKDCIAEDNAGDWFCDVKQLFPKIYNDLKVYICMLFDNKIEQLKNDFKAL